jgi:hypothetical protein
MLLWGMANGGAVHRMAFWIELGFNAQLVSFVFTIHITILDRFILHACCKTAGKTEKSSGRLSQSLIWDWCKPKPFP